VILSEPWDIANGILTPTLKIKRHRLNQLFNHKFDAWSQSGLPIIWD
jgi:long-chain acyl-CoA synthetase